MTMLLPYRPLAVGGVQILTSMTEAETERLRDLAAGRAVLEVGSAHGWSTCNIAEVAESVVAVDVHDETAGHAAPNSLAVLTGNLDALGLSSKVQVTVGWSRQALPELWRAEAMFDGVFVDGDHSLEGCAYDLAMGWLMLRRSGFLAVHDYDEDGHCPDVKVAVDAFAAQRTPGVTFEGLIDTLWIARKR
jgi:predicted O-methyltransferase YrrM